MVMIPRDDMAAFLASPSYRASLAWHSDRGCTITPLEKNISISIALKALKASGCTIEQLAAILDSDFERFNAFASARMKLYRNDEPEEYPPGEEPGPEDRPKTLAVLGYPEVFLVVPLVEFAILSSCPADVEAFAKRYRMPKAKEHARLLRDLFAQDGRPLARF